MRGFFRLIAKPNMWLAFIVTAAFSFPFGNSVSAARTADRPADFIIHADSISGDMLPPTLVIEDGKAYLRFQYTKATIHGLTLTKVLHTSKGPMTVKIKAPSATATNMKVDVSAFTFGGACLKLGEPVPQAGLKNVTLAVHKQTADELNLADARIASLSGDHGMARPSVPNLLDGLAGMKGSALNQAVDQLIKGHAPLLQCAGSNTGKTTEKKRVRDIETVVEKAMSPVDETTRTVNDLTGGTGQTINNVVKGTKKTVNTVTQDTEGLIDDAVSGNVDELPKDAKQTVCDGVDQLNKQLDQLSANVEEVNQQAEAILAGSQSSQESLTGLMGNLKTTKKKIDSLTTGTVSQDQLQALENETKKLQTEEKQVQMLKDSVKKANYADRLNKLEKELAGLKEELKQLEEASLCSKDAYNNVGKELDATSSKLNKAKTQMSALQADFSKANGFIKDLVAEIEKFIQQAQTSLGGGLLGGINDVLNGLLGNIQDLLDGIKKETGQ